MILEDINKNFKQLDDKIQILGQNQNIKFAPQSMKNENGC